MNLTNDMAASFAILVASLVVLGLMYRLEKKPRMDLTPRLVPTTLIMGLALFLALGAGVHILGIWGIKPPVR